MPYKQSMSTIYPGCILILIDQSGSMSEPTAGGQGKTKAEAVAEAVNEILNVVIIESSQGFVVKDRFYVGVIGYGTNEADAVDYARPAFSDPNLSGRNLIPISEIENNKLGHHEMLQTEQSDDTGKPEEKTSQVPYWFEPMAYGKTPMCQAFRLAYDILREWVDDPKHKKCFPPIVINITDGMPTDGSSDDLIAAAKRTMGLSTSDGNTLVYNCCISSTIGDFIQFPSDTAGIKDELAVTLFEASSIIPETLLYELTTIDNRQLAPGARGFVFNAKIIDLVLMLRWCDGAPLSDMRPEK